MELGLLQACEGGGRSRRADWGPKEQPNFSSLLPVTYPKWHSAVHGERGRESGVELRRSERSVSVLPPSVVLIRVPIFFAKTMQFTSVLQSRRG